MKRLIYRVCCKVQRLAVQFCRMDRGVVEYCEVYCTLFFNFPIEGSVCVIHQSFILAGLLQIQNLVVEFLIEYGLCHM